MRPFLSGVVAFAAVAAGFAGCDPAGGYLRADVASFEIASDDTSNHALVVEASSSWIIDPSGVPGWLTVWYDATNPYPDPNLLWLKASVNEDTEDRSAEISLVSGEGLTLAIPFVQLGMVVSFDVSPLVLEPFPARDASPQTLPVDTPLSWEAVQLHGDWITLTREAEGVGNILSVGVKPSQLFDPRSDTIVLRPARADYREFADSIVVVQHASDLAVVAETMDEDTLEIAIPAAGGEVPLSVYSRHSWTLSTDAPPEIVSIDLTAHEGNSIESGTPIVMKVAPNSSSEQDFTFTLTFASEGKTYKYLCRQPKSSPPEPEQK
jgi:hypothetical protein